MMQLATTERTRLFVDGVQAAITADVTRRRHDGLVVAQALPFLRLDTPVTGADGRRTRISRVEISMDGDTPRLLLELLDDHAEEAEVKVEEAAPVFTPGVSTRPPRRDSTLPYARLDPRDEDVEDLVLRDPPALDFRMPAPEPPAWYLRLWALLLSFIGVRGVSGQQSLPRET